jgi:predicted thioredoxin/glutaredoxin
MIVIWEGEEKEEEGLGDWEGMLLARSLGEMLIRGIFWGVECEGKEELLHN